MVARLSLSNEQLSIDLWLLIASSKKTSLFQLHHSKPRESSIEKSTSGTSIFRNPGQWIFYHIPIMPCNLSFPANLGNEDVSSFFLSEDNLHPTGAFDESRFKETPIRTLTEWTPWYWRRRSFPLRMYFFPYFSWPHGRISWFRFHFTLSGISSKVLCLTAAPFLLAWWFPFLSLIHSVATSGWKPTTSLQPCCPVLTKAA